MAQKTDKDKKEEPSFSFDEEAPDFEMEEEIPLFEETEEEGPPEKGPEVIDLGDIEPDILGGEEDEGPSIIEVEEGPSLEDDSVVSPIVEDEGPPFEATEDTPPFEIEEVSSVEDEAPPFEVEEGPSLETGTEGPPLVEDEAPPFEATEETPPFAMEEGDEMEAPPFADAEEVPGAGEDMAFEAPGEGPGEGDAPFLEAGEEFPGFDEAGEGFSFDESDDSGDVGDISEKVAQIENKITQCDMGLTTIKEMDSQISEKAAKIDKHIQELLSIYELVTNEINPFVERFEMKPRRIKKIIKKKKAAGAAVPAGVTRVEPETVAPSVSVSPAAPASVPSVEGPLTRAMAREVGLLSIGDDPESITILLRWLKFLMSRVGSGGLMDVLMHYENTGWIGPDVRNKVIKYAKGILSDQMIDYAPMDVKDHMISLYFITKLQGLEIDPRLYSSIYSDLAAMEIVD